MGSWFACNVNQHRNLWLFGLGLCYFLCLKKPCLCCLGLLSCLPDVVQGLLLSSQLLSDFLTWVVCSFFEENAFSRSQDLPGGADSVVSLPQSRRMGAGNPHPELGPATTWAKLTPILHSPHCIAFVTLLGDYRLLENKDYVFHLQSIQSLASYRCFINTAC